MRKGKIAQGKGIRRTLDFRKKMPSVIPALTNELDRQTSPFFPLLAEVTTEMKTVAMMRTDHLV